MENIPLMQWIGSLVLSGIGGYIGVRVAVVQLQVKMEFVQSEVQTLRKRTHRHSTLLTLLAARVGISQAPSMMADEEG